MRRIETYIRRAVLWALVPMGMLAALSCQDDLVAERQPVQTGDEIAFALAKDSAWVTLSRSAESASPAVKETRRFLTLIGKDSLFLYVRVEDNTDQPFRKSSDSRAASNTTEDLGEFYLDAFYNGSTPFMNGTKVEWKDDAWKYSPLKYWPNNEGDYLDFYGYTDYPDVFQWKTKHESFSYTLPEEAENQQDLIFAQALNQSKQTVNGKVLLNFYHALSAVLFKVGSLPEDIKVSNLKITLADVKNGGTCTISNTDNGELSFAWDTDDADLKAYSQEFTSSDASNGYEAEDDISTISSEQAFMMVPHTFGDDARLCIDFEIGGVPHSFDHPLIIEGVDDGDEWKPNTKYTYILSIEEFVEVEVEEAFEQGSNVKENVRFQNTGLSDVRMRAAIVGYWVVNEEEDVILPWNIDNEKQGTAVWGSNWTKKEDGFYYYNDVVAPSAYTENLFDKYQLEQNPPVMGAKLVLNVVVQAVAVEVFEGENAPWEL